MMAQVVRLVIEANEGADFFCVIFGGCDFDVMGLFANFTFLKIN
jgi:hypothetical protein